MKRTNPEAAEATGRSTGETSMTAWVVSVLFSPRNMPDRMTATIRRIGSTRPRPMNETTHANATADTAVGWRNGLDGAPWPEGALGVAGAPWVDGAPRLDVTDALPCCGWWPWPCAGHLARSAG